MKADYFRLNRISANNICLILIILIPPALVTGPFIPDFFLSVASIIFLYICFRDNRFYYFNNIFFKLFSIFWLYLVLNSLFSENILHSLKISIFYFRFGIFCILVNYLISTKKKFIDLFFYTLVATMIFVSFDAYIQYFFGRNLLGMSPLEFPRISGLFGDELILGSYLSRLIPLSIGIFFLKKIDIKLILIFLVFIEVLIVITGERTAIGLIGLSTIFFILLLDGFKILRIISICLVFIISTLIFSQFSETKQRVIDHTFMELGTSSNKQVQINFEGVKPIYKNYFLFSPKHQSLIITSYNMYKDKKLLGHGPRSFKYKCNDPKYQLNRWSCASHPHNIVSQILAEIGLVGIIFYLMIIIYLMLFFYNRIFSKAFKKVDFNNYQICLIVSLILTIWPFIPSGNIFSNWLSIIFYLPIGFYLNSINDYSNESNNRK